MTPRAARVWSRLLAACAAAAAVVALSPPPAGADPIADARARAAALARTVTVLQTRAEVATERYDAVVGRLGSAVTARLLAERDLESARTATATDQTVSDDRVRALYEAGGPVSLFATVLDGADLSDALARYHSVDLVLSADRVQVGADAARAARAGAVEARLSQAAARVTQLQSAVATAAATVRSALLAQQQALAGANAEVRHLVAQAQAAAAAASAASFRQAVLDAGGVITTDMAPPNATVAKMLAVARSKLGDPYVWGATGPDSFDCSGLTQFSYAAAGIALPRVAADQWNVGQHVGLDALLPGDLLFWATNPNDPATIHHVAIYLGGGMMLAAPHTGDVVKVQPVYLDGFIGATRPWQAG